MNIHFWQSMKSFLLWRKQLLLFCSWLSKREESKICREVLSATCTLCKWFYIHVLDPTFKITVTYIWFWSTNMRLFYSNYLSLSKKKEHRLPCEIIASWFWYIYDYKKIFVHACVKSSATWSKVNYQSWPIHLDLCILARYFFSRNLHSDNNFEEILFYGTGISSIVE